MSRTLTIHRLLIRIFLPSLPHWNRDLMLYRASKQQRSDDQITGEGIGSCDQGCIGITRMGNRRIHQEYWCHIQIQLDKTPMNRLAMADDVANAVYLAYRSVAILSQETSYRSMGVAHHCKWCFGLSIFYFNRVSALCDLKPWLSIFCRKPESAYISKECSQIF